MDDRLFVLIFFPRDCRGHIEKVGDDVSWLVDWYRKWELASAFWGEDK